jgi:hypothetical protein
MEEAELRLTLFSTIQSYSLSLFSVMDGRCRATATPCSPTMDGRCRATATPCSPTMDGKCRVAKQYITYLL